MLTVLLIVHFYGKQKEIDTRESSINDLINLCIELIDRINEVELLFDRLDQTIQEFSNVVDQKQIEEEVLKISLLLNERIPVLHNKITTRLRLFFQNDRAVERIFIDHKDKLSLYYNYMIQFKAHKDRNTLLSDIKEYKKINSEVISSTDDLIELLLKDATKNSIFSKK